MPKTQPPVGASIARPYTNPAKIHLPQQKLIPLISPCYFRLRSVTFVTSVVTIFCRAAPFFLVISRKYFLYVNQCPAIVQKSLTNWRLSGTLHPVFKKVTKVTNQRIHYSDGGNLIHPPLEVRPGGGAPLSRSPQRTRAKIPRFALF